MTMTHQQFENFAKEIVYDFAKEHLDKSDDVEPFSTLFDFSVYIVWSCKTLQNSKALLSTTLPDGMYYEVTLNGDKNEIYFDAYKKFQNLCIPLPN